MFLNAFILHILNTACSGKLFLFRLYLFPDVAALMDIPYIRRYSAVRPTLQTLASSPPHPSPRISLALLCVLWPFTFPSTGIKFSTVWCIFMSEIT